MLISKIYRIALVLLLTALAFGALPARAASGSGWERRTGSPGDSDPGPGAYHLSPTGQLSTAATFTDVPFDHMFWSYIEAFYDAGITTGCSTDPLKFCPYDNVTRGEMAVFIERALGNFNPSPNPTGMFADVPDPGQPPSFQAFIEQFYNDGITTGCSSNPLKYCPQNYVTRGEMAVFIERALGNFNPSPNPTGMFADVPDPGQPPSFQAFIEQFYNDGITTGCAGNPLRYCPQNNVTRQEMAVFIVRAFNIPLPPLPPVSGLRGHWKYDENSWAGDCSTADILDSSGNNRHGIACINGDAPSPVPGKFGNAGRFDGIDQYANMGPGFNFTSSFTAAMWIALDDYDWCGPTGKSQHIIGTHDLRTPIGNGRGWGIYWDCSGLAWELTNSTGSAIGSYGYVQPSPFPVNGSWHHIALVYNSSVPSAALYWDGVLVYSESGTANVPSFLFNNGEPLTVNGLPYAPSAGAPGKIDDTRVYNRALSAEEIASIYQAIDLR